VKLINRYLEFILESVSKNEMRLHYSDEFRNLLTKISNKIDWVKLLLAAEDSNQISDIYTLIDITDKNDTISFIQVNRILRAEPETVKYPDSDVYFLPRKITNVKSNEFWNRGRTEMSIGRWVRRVIFDLHKSSISDSEIEKFVNQYKSSFDDKDKNNFEIVKGDDIKKWYLSKNYESEKGQLGSSCMRYDRCQQYFDIYTKNPEVCSLLIMKSTEDTDKIVGRALLWNLKDGRKYQDRIYTINDSDKILFSQWADNNGYKKYDSSHLVKEVQLGNHDYEKYPYMDTFVCYNPSHKLLTSDEDFWPSQGYYKLRETNGECMTDDFVYSDYADEYISRDRAVYCENIRDYINRDDAVYLDYIDQWAYPNDSIVHSDFHGEYFYDSDVRWSECMSDVLNPDYDGVISIIINSSGDEDYCHISKTEHYIKVNDEYYSRFDIIKNPFTGEIIFKDEKDNEGIKVSDKIYYKIEEELFGKRLKTDEMKSEVYKKLTEIYNSGKLNDKIINSLESNPIFDGVKVYWGLPKDKQPTSSTCIELVFSVLMNEYTLKSPNINRVRVTQLIINTRKLNEEIAELYSTWEHYDSRIIRIIVRAIKTINWSEVDEEFYKYYLLLTI
jgi:hypothetical protein